MHNSFSTRFFLLSLAVMLTGVLMHFSALAQKEAGYLRQGNSAYQKGDFKKAETLYRKALEQKKDYYKGLFNLGDALYKMKKYDEAGQVFDQLAHTEGMDKYVVSKSYHNLGNSLLQQKKYQESINAYKNALKINPKDTETKYNLEYARKKMIQQQQQQQQKQNQNQQNQQQKQQQQKDQQKNQQKDQQKNQQQNQQKDQQQPSPQKDQISKDDAERMLNALRNQELKTLDKLKKEEEKSKQEKPEKDW